MRDSVLPRCVVRRYLIRDERRTVRADIIAAGDQALALAWVQTLLQPGESLEIAAVGKGRARPAA